MHLILAVLFLAVCIWAQIADARFMKRQREEAIRQAAEEMARRDALWRKAEEAFETELALLEEMNRTDLTLEERCALVDKCSAASEEARKLAIYRHL
jgi:hypothetical protein